MELELAPPVWPSAFDNLSQVTSNITLAGMLRVSQFDVVAMLDDIGFQKVLL